MPKHPEHPSLQSHSTTSEPHPGCDPSNGKWCIMEERAAELMKRVAGWHFQTDNWSRMTFTQKKPQRQSLKRVLWLLYGSRAEKRETLRPFLRGTGSLAELSFFWQEGVGQIEDGFHNACYIWKILWIISAAQRPVWVFKTRMIAQLWPFNSPAVLMNTLVGAWLLTCLSNCNISPLR